MNELKKQTKKEIETRTKETINNINTEDGLKKEMSYRKKSYKGSFELQRLKFINYLNKKKFEEIQKQNAFIDEVNKAENFKGDFVITIEWTKSRMWGLNPKAHTSEGFESRNIGGWGYCKLSTATAEALNSDLRILKLLFKAKNKYLKNNPKTTKSTSDINREILGYGSGYNMIPSFEGGVGVSSHERILKKLGLEMKNLSSTKTTDVYLIKKRKVE